MIGRYESMTNLVREPDLTSNERDLAHAIAERMLCALTIYRVMDEFSIDELALLARATKLYCPLPVPGAAHPSLQIGPAERTMPVGQVLGVIEPDPSDGVCSIASDAPTAIASVDHTAMHRDQNGNGFIVKRGSSDQVAIPNTNTLPTHRR